MNKKMFVGIGIFVVVMLVVAVLGAMYYKNKENDDKKVVIVEEALKFKKEYENENGKKNNAGKEYIGLEISEKNIIKYKNEREILEIIKGGTGVIYFGFPTCPWCRALVPVLLRALENNEVNDLYYLNIFNNRSKLNLNDKDEVVIIQNGTDGYYKLLEAMDSVLDDYLLESTVTKTKKGKAVQIETGEKRLFAPTVIAVVDGKIEAIHVGTVDAHDKDPYKALTKKQEENLYKSLNKLVKLVSDSECSDNKGC